MTKAGTLVDIAIQFRVRAKNGSLLEVVAKDVGAWERMDWEKLDGDRWT